MTTAMTAKGFGCSTKLSTDRIQKLDNSLLQLIVGKVLPPSLVENEFFIKFTNELDPRYKLPSRKKLMDMLSKKKEEMSEKVKEEIKGCSGVGLTHDGWTSVSTESYNTTTIHYINEKWEMKSAVLSTKKLEGSHTGERIAETLTETKIYWGIPKIIATTDNAANERKAFELLGWKRFGCYGHRINLIIKHALDIPETSKVLGKGRKLVTLFHTSSSTMDLLRQKQEILLESDKVGHKLIADVQTRWNSSLAMLERILEQIPALMAVAVDEKISKSVKTTLKNTVYTFEETAIVERLVTLLKPFLKATEIVCGEMSPTITKVLPIIVKLSKVIVEGADDPPIIRAIKAKMQKEIGLRLLEDEELVLLGCILNPYTKDFNFLPEKKSQAENVLRRYVSGVEVIQVKIKKGTQ
ncbi:E3 SUMO-protein ligase ZBED1-like [Argopecten irradians]|uniref:E3 SUMO-protein ligase ZBED1-like n=1 Tax=Argopecten irradians TaxID=31199 RepID=UPI00371FC236